MGALITVNESPCSDIKYLLLHKQSLGFSHVALRVTGKVLASSSRPKGFHAVLALPGICFLTDFAEFPC